MTFVDSETIIHMKDDTVKITTKDELGISKVINTNLEELKNVFLVDSKMETPFLPSQWGVVKYYKKQEYEGFVLTTPPTIRKVVFDSRGHKSEPVELPVPPLLWIFEVLTSGKKRSLTHSMVFALRNELLSLADMVYEAPFPNIGISNGICWGNNNTPSVQSSRSLQNIPAQFFSQPFNGDLSQNRVKSFESVHTQGKSSTCGLQFMKHLSKTHQVAATVDKPFLYPFDMLKVSGHSTAQQVIEKYLPNILMESK